MTPLSQMSNGYSIEWKVPSVFEGKLLREFLIDRRISKRTLTSVKFDGGMITVNGNEVNVRHTLKAGDDVKLTFPPEHSSVKLIPEEVPLDIVYEDGDVLVVNKPSGMSSIPSKEHTSGTLANAIAGYYRANDLSYAVHIVTRLDRDTSGLVLIAKHRHVHHLFSIQQQNREISREYEALAEGVMNEVEGLIDQPIGRKETSIIEREVRADGQSAKTRFVVMDQYPHAARLTVRPLTGRTHQIRVHMASIGHPLLGDDLYGGKTNLMNRQALHCRSLSFFHPLTHEWVNVEAQVAEDMNAAMRQLDKQRRDPSR
ncbi:RluA family pseudouridine synthase [Rossellomorea aquimaris]|uniref:RluA family pseudouridine synthase n=1 Tax=Rossellomorea aquimaris TaxID=189382 RepID=UPI001CD425D6|nr:RluA family pseudouridine synthase [Rossellomorea aquimaris]MCA1056723.1 RluA family pseudouridine synthase [Rossellomorea aquimaris]